jgi:hypothetical protein
MTSHPDFVRPPSIAVRLVNLFIPAHEAESILGDLLEEFTGFASKSGIAPARSWYWRQALKTTSSLAWAGFRAAPWSTLAAVAGGYLVITFALSWPAGTRIIVRDRNWVNEHRFDIFWITAGLPMVRVIVATLIGGIVAAVAREREMTATITLSAAMSGCWIASALRMVARTGYYGFLRPFPWVLAFSIATIVGGAVVRSCRTPKLTRPAAM